MNNLRQIDLANKTGFSKSRISQWVNGQSTPSKKILKELANFLNVNENWLMGKEDSPMRSPEPCIHYWECNDPAIRQVILSFLRLDSSDRIKIAERIAVLSEDKKYQQKEEGKE